MAAVITKNDAVGVMSETVRPMVARTLSARFSSWRYP